MIAGHLMESHAMLMDIVIMLYWSDAFVPVPAVVHNMMYARKDAL